MFSPTLTHEMTPYLVACTALGGVGASTITIRLHQRSLAAHGFSFGQTYSLILLMVVALGLMVVEGAALFGTYPTIWLVSLPLGIGLGWASYRADQTISRFLQRRSRRTTTDPTGKAGDQRRYYQNLSRAVIHPVGAIGASSGERATPGQGEGGVAQPTLRDLLIIAVLEELLFRGVLLQMALQLPGPIPVLCAIAALTIAFSASHIYFGWRSVVAKIPLAFLTLAGTVITGSIISAIVGHLLFNRVIYKETERRAFCLAERSVT